MIEQKIAEIVEQLCIVCPSEITCGFDMREKASKAILALIASEQAPLILELQKARGFLERLLDEAKSPTFKECIRKDIAQIDAVLEGK